MSTAQENMYKEALSAIQAGDRNRARDLLTRLLKSGQENHEYWIWMSAVVETQKERIFCLKEAMRLDPQNMIARRGLTLFGTLPPEPGLVLPARFQKRGWQVKLPTDNADAAKTLPRYQIAMIVVGMIVVVGLIVYAIFGARSRLANQPLLIRLPSATALAGVQLTPTQARTPTAGSPTPLWMLLKATYTPTPLYVNTPHPVSEAYRIGLRAFQRADWGGAANYFNQVLTNEPGAIDAMYYLGESYRQQGNATQAIDMFTKGIQQSPNFAPLYLGRARARFDANPKAFKDVLADLQTAVEQDPNYAEAYLEMAHVQIKVRQPGEALLTLEQAAALLPASPSVYLYRAEANLALGKNDQALADARKANELDITMLLAYRMIGQVLIAKGDLPGAQESLKTYLLYEPNDPEAWVWVAKADYAGKDLDLALKSLDKALRLNNKNLDGLLLRGQILLDQGKAEKAMDDYNRAVQLDEESFAARIGLSKALMAVGTRATIGDAYAQIEAAKPLAETEREKAERLYWLAYCLEKLSEKQAAVRNWQLLLAMPKASVDPAWLAYAQKRLSELITQTPTPLPKTPTPTVTNTSTRWPTQTKQPTATRKPTLTSSPTPTPKTPSPTPTKKP